MKILSRRTMVLLRRDEESYSGGGVFTPASKCTFFAKISFVENACLLIFFYVFWPISAFPLDTKIFTP